MYVTKHIEKKNKKGRKKKKREVFNEKEKSTCIPKERKKERKSVYSVQMIWSSEYSDQSAHLRSL